MKLRALWLCAALVLPLLFLTASPAEADDGPLHLTLRTRVRTPGQEGLAVVDRKAKWQPKKTALIICDMWDDHWCQSASRRVAELTGPINDLTKLARSHGVFVIHAPSSVTAFYKDTPQRRRAQQAPFVLTPVALAKTQRWGTGWCGTDAKREGVLPIDDSDMGCDCRVKCSIREAWTLQTGGIALAPEDALTDDGQETWNLLAQRGIEHVLICGVHLNMCVLGRPFGIRQQVYLGKQVVLLRDLTDTMYNPERPPGVNHFAGTDLVVAHVEQFWCPSCTSSDLTGKPAFRFKDDTRSLPGK